MARAAGDRLRARIRVPGSKSLTNRHLVIAALADGDSRLSGVLRSDDCDRLVTALAAMGVGFEWDAADPTVLRVRGVAGRPCATPRVDLGDGGTPTRFMLAVAALASGRTEIDGSARMRERPIDEGVDLLRAIGARAEFPRVPRALPVIIEGPREGESLDGGGIEVGKTASSQFISALMLIAPWTARGIQLRFTDEPTSASYIALSLAALAAHGVDASSAYGPVPIHRAAPGAGLRNMRIASQTVAGADIAIEPDASSAVYPAALAAIMGGSVELVGCTRRSLQPDSWFLDDLALRGVTVEEAPPCAGVPSVFVRSSGVLQANDADYERAPDAAVMAMVVAACADRPSRFTGLSTLRVKESDRIATVAAGLRALGGRVETGEDWVIVHPLPAQFTPATIEVAADHRIAMAFAILGSVRGGVTIDDPGVVAKSWPGFWTELDLLAGQVCRQNGGQ
ncbi:MAG: 3-phosphoshikimate 1-carboxyvinyltransferase [Planctomycetota bacterium]